VAFSGSENTERDRANLRGTRRSVVDDGGNKTATGGTRTLNLRFTNKTSANRRSFRHTRGYDEIDRLPQISFRSSPVMPRHEQSSGP
jgi:hypothetical protein